VTITVVAPAASVDVYCATTTERAPFDHIHVSPEAIMDAYHQWCSPVRSESVVREALGVVEHH
jgi:hypothetical protein